MPKLPVVSAREAIKVAEKVGFKFIRQRGSHIILENEENQLLVIPFHQALKKGTLNQIIKTLGITREEFINLLK